MSRPGDVYRLSQPLITASLALAVADRRLPDGTPVRQIADRMAELVHAARAFMDAVNDLEAGEMPKTWRPDPEARAS